MEEYTLLLHIRVTHTRCMFLFVMKKYVKWLKQEAISWYCLRNETYVLVMRIRCMCLFVMKEYVKWLSGLVA